MMFGTRDEFDYVECSGCGTVQIAAVPDLAPYYPPEYISFDADSPVGKTFIHRIAARLVGRYLMHGRGLAGKLLVQIEPRFKNHYPAYLRDFPLGIDFNSRILDFGCGNGRLLQSLHHFGFRNLAGADAFIGNDLYHPSGVTIFKKRLAELEPAFDLVMLHHSFEHLPDPQDSLAEIKRLLKRDGHCLIRVPVINDAWTKYGVNWVQLDPPRHLFLYTERAMRELAESSGFAVDRVVYDSTGFQFWGSEQYLRDIPLVPEGSRGFFEPPEIFSDEQLKEWEDKAGELNRDGRGDQACFYLSPA